MLLVLAGICPGRIWETYEPNLTCTAGSQGMQRKAIPDIQIDSLLYVLLLPSQAYLPDSRKQNEVIAWEHLISRWCLLHYVPCGAF